jgi:hypothetical protein
MGIWWGRKVAAPTSTVIPAKAGIQTKRPPALPSDGLPLDSRFRGNDGEVSGNGLPLDSRFRGNDGEVSGNGLPLDSRFRGNDGEVSGDGLPLGFPLSRE